MLPWPRVPDLAGASVRLPTAFNHREHAEEFPWRKKKTTNASVELRNRLRDLSQQAPARF